MIDTDTSIDGRPVIRSAWPERIFGCDNGPVHTLVETAEYLVSLGYPRMSHEAIRQIEESALAKLRTSPILRKIAREKGISLPEDHPDAIAARLAAVESAIIRKTERDNIRKSLPHKAGCKLKQQRAQSPFLQRLYGATA